MVLNIIILIFSKVFLREGHKILDSFKLMAFEVFNLF